MATPPVPSRNATEPTEPGVRFSSLQTLGEISRFLRESVVDDESHQLRDSMRALASHLEIMVSRGLSHQKRAVMASRLADLQVLLTQHHAMLVGLSPSWRRVDEYSAYLSALQHFRSRVDVWQSDVSDRRRPALWAADFELLAWRMLGAGVLLLDLQEQAHGAQTAAEAAAAAPTSQPDPQATWWQRLRRWLR